MGPAQLTIGPIQGGLVQPISPPGWQVLSPEASFSLQPPWMTQSCHTNCSGRTEKSAASVTRALGLSGEGE